MFACLFVYVCIQYNICMVFLFPSLQCEGDIFRPFRHIDRRDNLFIFPLFLFFFVSWMAIRRSHRVVQNIGIDGSQTVRFIHMCYVYTFISETSNRLTLKVEHSNGQECVFRHDIKFSYPLDVSFIGMDRNHKIFHFDQKICIGILRFGEMDGL